MRILLVEDDTHVARFIAKGLREQSFAVDVSADGEAALYQVSMNLYDLIILDVMIPNIDGFEVCRRLRALNHREPIIMLTARDTVADRIAGLDIGADDYLTKPFEFGELLARMRALLRRRGDLRPEQLIIADLIIDTRSHAVKRNTRTIELTAKEYALLEYLASNIGRVIGRAEIAEHVWDENFDPFSNLIEVYINRLRRKIDGKNELQLIHTRRGTGYMLALLDENINLEISPEK